MLILLVASNPSVISSAELMLKAAGHMVTVIDVGEDAAYTAKQIDFDLILMDSELADMPGIDVLRDVRRKGIKTPVILLSPNNDIAMGVNALNAGADDFVLRPFQAEELAARIVAVGRRAKGFSQNIMAIGPISLNFDACTVQARGIPLHVTGKEWQILSLLALRRGMTLTKDMMLDALYGGMDEPCQKIVDVFICKLRKKLIAAAGHPIIETVWGRGYLIPTDEFAPDLAAAA